jgi:tetratricopeptide (TPR) repeat protein
MIHCPRHSRKRASGYCIVCGDLGCEECLHEYEGAWYCDKHYQPVREKLERDRHHEYERNKRERQRLVVHTREGEIAYGVSLSLNTGAEGFYLELMDKRGNPLNQTHYVAFKELKAVFYVKSYDGRFDPDRDYPKVAAGANLLVVEFTDGEVVHGRTMRPYTKKESRFHLIPDEKASNNINVLVEQAAVRFACSPEEYEEKHKQDVKTYLSAHQRDGEKEEELHGDYYFEKHDYEKALKYYRLAREKGEVSHRLKKKIVMTKYNLGVRHIKRHEYERALDCMRLVLQMDPENEKALKKIRQLQEVLRKKRAAP